MKALLFSMTALVTASGVFAGAANSEYLKSFEFDIKIQTLEAIREQVSQDTVVKKYKLAMPILPPRLSPEQVTVLVDQEVEAMVEAELPKKHFKQIEVDARNRFRMYKTGDLITVKVLDRRKNKDAVITRFIRKMDKRGLYLDDEYFIFKDVNKVEYPHFFQKYHDDAVNRYIVGKSKAYKINREDYEKKTRRRLAKKIWRAEGYVYRKKKRKWTPREEVFNYLFQKQLLASFKKSRPDIENIVFDQAGLKWNEELQEWHTPGSEPTMVDPETMTVVERVKDGVKGALKNWDKEIENLFSDGKGKGNDIWDEDETGDDSDKNTEKEDKEKGKKEEKGKEK